ncbi:hypothetical protein [uncultured Megasphaera sp.]|uniref:hypothetical protein n=1 Tax=uncultured Megasphaera sp. TaxID=165188 RepID=UPI00265D14E2|nr:hypothetical protein [uncultured Megasphaera sp.]
MMKAKDIINLVRYQLKDNNAVQYSDYDVMQALNSCLRYINQYYINSDFLEQVVYYREDEINAQIDEANQTADTPVAHVSMKLTGVDLPDDFLSLVRVVRECDGVDMHPCQAIKTPWPREYKILQNKIYAGVKDIAVMYNIELKAVSSVDDTINLPGVFRDALAKLTCTILANNPDTDTMQSAFEDVLRSIVPLRRYSNMRKKMPFYC